MKGVREWSEGTLVRDYSVYVCLGVDPRRRPLRLDSRKDSYINDITITTHTHTHTGT